MKLPQDCRRHPVSGADERRGRHDEQHDDRELDRDDDVVDPRRFLDADDQQRRDAGDHHHRRQVEDRAGRVPGAVAGIVGERGDGEGRRHHDAEVLEEAHDIARPADRDRGGAERVFEDQIPADDPGDELAHRRVGIGVGAAGDRHHRGHLGVAEAGEGAGEGAEHERQGDRRTGVRGGGMPVSTKMPAPMIAPMPSETRLKAERLRLSGTPSWVVSACTSGSAASASSAAIDLRVQIFAMAPSVT